MFKLKNIVGKVFLTSILCIGFLGLVTTAQAAAKGAKVISTRQVSNQPTVKLFRGSLYKNKSMNKIKANLGSKKNKLHNQIAVVRQQLKVRKLNGKKAVVYRVTFKHHPKTTGYVWAKGLKLSKKITFKKSATKSTTAQAVAKKASKALQAKAKKQGWGNGDDPYGYVGHDDAKDGQWMAP